MATIKPTPAPLPEGILKSDLVRPTRPTDYWDWTSKKQDKWDKQNLSVEQFNIIRTERFGWCIPTLFISKARYGNTARSYGISIKDSQAVSIGSGPHVLEDHTVYVTPDRLEDLQKYLDIKLKGEQKAHEIRDVRASRRAMGSLRRRALF